MEYFSTNHADSLKRTSSTCLADSAVVRAASLCTLEKKKDHLTMQYKTNMEHKIMIHLTFTSLSADSEMLAAASSLTRAIVSAAPAAASAAARRAWKQ